MPSLKLLAGAAHDLAHHVQSGVGYVIPHLTKVCRASNVAFAEVELLTEKPYPVGLPRLRPLKTALCSLQQKFWEILEHTGIARAEVKSVRLKFDIAASSPDGYSCPVTAVITAQNGKVFQQHLDITWYG